MISIDCPRHDARVLVGASRIRSFHNTPYGIYLSVDCYCGQRVAIATGRNRPTSHPTPVLAAA
jgi:hypothetical protein